MVKIVITHISFLLVLICSGVIPVAAQDRPKTKSDTTKTMRLDDVVVMGSQSARPVKLSPITTRVLSGRGLVESGYSDFQQALQHETPGLSIQKVTFGSEINLDGLDARHVLFLTDGERMTGDMAGNLDYERFNLHAIDRVEIVKGASSTLYGSRASGAVINIITKKTNEPFSFDAGFRWGQMNERNFKNPKKKDFIYMFEKNADRPNLQGWLSAGFKRGAFTSQSDVWYSESDAFYLYQAKNDRKVYTKEANPFLEKDIILESSFPRPPMGIEGREHIIASQKLYFEPSTNLKAQAYGSVFFINQYDLVQDLVLTQGRDYTWGAKMSYSLKNWLTITASVHSDFYDRFKRHERRDERKPVYHSRIFQPRLTLSSNYFPGHALVMGIEHCGDRLTSDRFVNHKMTSRTLKETEFYMQDDWTANDYWMISAGVRTNFSEAFGFMYMPKIAAKFSPDDHWAIRANYSMGYRSPSIKELFFNWDHLGMFMIKGNEFLKPEKSNYVSAGVEYSDSHFFFNGTVYGNFYRKKIEGIWRIYDMQYNFEYANLNRQKMAGFDLLGRWTPTDWLTLNASYSYVYVSKDKGLRINTTSPHAATAGIKYSHRKKNYRLDAYMNAQIMGEKQYDVQDRVYVEKEGRSYDAYFRCTLPTYALCNLNVAQTFKEKIRLSLGIDNIFNYKPKTLGSGLTAFSVPATAGARAYIQLEFKIR